MRAAAAGLAAALALAGCSHDEAAPAPAPRPAHGEETGGVISETRAIELARAACAGKAEIPPGVKATVTRTDGRIVVVFPTSLPSGTRGADWHAKVTLDAKTGAVVEVLGGT